MDKSTYQALLKNVLLIDDKEQLENKKLSFLKKQKAKYVYQKIKRGKPIQYYYKTINFYGNEFLTSKKLLIPRFETELLVEKTTNYIKEFQIDPKIIDLGCGTGIIGITLKKNFPKAEVKAIDIDYNALKITKQNAKLNGVSIEIKQQNMLLSDDNQYNVIISNPPYISSTEIIEEIVYNNEPHHALFAPNDGLYYYEQILKSAVKNAMVKSIIAFEIGEKQGEKIKELAYRYFPNATVKIEKDYNNFDRFIFIFIDQKFAK